jgi:hypothetical protein
LQLLSPFKPVQPTRLLHLAAAEPALVATEPRLAEVQAFGSPDAWRAELAALRPDVNITC